MSKVYAVTFMDEDPTVILGLLDENKGLASFVSVKDDCDDCDCGCEEITNEELKEFEEANEEKEPEEKKPKKAKKAKRKPRGRMTDSVRDSIVRMRNDGLSYDKIGKEVGFSGVTVRNAFLKVKK